ncbi:uncharacterized protein [Dendrobates tinctorius]|uniref:uncharacterized protein n=1 Tax=Dendrobates tinctorius TaxID=92724 RepID=UPI003CC9281E
MGSARGGSIRHQGELENDTVLLPKPQGDSSGSRCASDKMGLQASLRLSSPISTSSSVEEDQERQGKGHSHRPVLAQKSMVFELQDHVGRRSLGSPGHPGPSVPGPGLPPSGGWPTSHGVEFERSLLESKGFSPDLIDTLLKSRKVVTTKIYVRIWKRFLESSNVNTGDSVPIGQILEFLQKGLDLGLSTSTLKVQVSALGALFSCNIAANYWVKRFIKAASRSRPIVKNRLTPWDLNLVLTAMTEAPFEPILSASIRSLSLKIAFLIAITSARRVSDIQALSRRPPFLQVKEDRVILRPDPAYLPKVASSFHRSQEIVLPSFLPKPTNEKEEKLHTLDVRRCLLEYLAATDPWKKDNALFVSYQGPRKGLRVSKSTLARWIREAISLAYASKGRVAPEKLKAHSTRAVATSWAERSEVSIDQICKAATWSSPSTFYSHYRLDLGASADLSFGNRVLQAVVPP